MRYVYICIIFMNDNTYYECDKQGPGGAGNGPTKLYDDRDGFGDGGNGGGRRER